MATRAERMKDRIRGAGYGQVGEVSFDIDFGDGPDSTSEEGSPESTTKTPTAPTNRTASVARNAEPSSPSEPRTALRTRQNTTSAVSSPTTIKANQVKPRERTPQPVAIADGDEDDLALPVVQSSLLGSTRSITSKRSSVLEVEEVTESPLRAPGSGRRRRIGTHDVSSSSIKLQRVMESEGNEPDADPLSSPSEQRTQRARASTGRHKTSFTTAEADELDELSPEQPLRTERTRSQASPDLSSPPKQRHANPGPPARELDATRLSSPVEAAQQLRKTRASRVSRPAEREVEEELSVAVEDPTETVAEPEPEPSPEPAAAPSPEASRKRRRKEKASPANQRQGRQKKPGKENTVDQEPIDKPARKRRRKAGEAGEGKDLVIYTQRFTKRRRVAEDEDPDFDILTAEIPFTKRSGANCVDVLTDVCNDVIESMIEALEGSKRHAVDAASRREIQVKTRVLEDYKAVLDQRLLEHTIQLENMHTLRQRVKHEQKEKAGLRDDIMRIRAEREDVAVRKDAIRAKHEKRRDEIMNQLDLSSALHDIDLAVDRGKQADDLSPAEEKKKADIVNLELLVSRLAEQSSTRSDAGGSLGQLKEFNAFLERAAEVLEGR